MAALKTHHQVSFFFSFAPREYGHRAGGSRDRRLAPSATSPVFRSKAQSACGGSLLFRLPTGNVVFENLNLELLACDDLFNQVPD
jgi:hypothetical protein